MCSWTVNARGKTRVDIFLSVHFSQIIQNKLYWNAYANMYIASAEPILAVGSSGVDSTWNPNDRVFKLAKAWIIYCIPSGKKSKIPLYPNCRENQQLFYNIALGLLQQFLLCRGRSHNYGGVEGPPHIFFRHHAISYGWHSNSSVGDSNYCYVIRRTY